MSLLDRAKRALEAARYAPDGETIEANLDAMLARGELDPQIQTEAFKQAVDKTKSFLEIRRTSDEILSFYSLLVRSVKEGDLPPHGDPTRDHNLAEFWKKEPILAGAVYSMSAKMSTLGWTVMGRRNLAKYYADLLSRAASMEGYDWGGFISSSAQDFYTVDRGVYWETPRKGTGRLARLSGTLEDIGHIDALQCAMTGNSKRPVFYLSEVTGQHRYFRPGEFVHFSSLPSPRELHMGIGFCASSRAWRAAKLLLGLHDYDEEKLSNLPPEGVASVSGLTMDEFQDALAMWKTAREKVGSLTFPQVLWLIGSQPNSKVGVDLTGFSQLPESFDRRAVVEQYVNTLALVFGVDAREFWPISTSSMGTAAESEIQHMKAKGKGPGEFVSIIERKLNGEMPDGVEFSFDTQDIAEDKESAEIAKIWIEALLPLVTGGAPGGPKMEQGQSAAQGEAAQPLQPAGPTNGAGSIITTDEFLRLLADRGVLPNYLVKDKRIVITDSGISEKEYNGEVSIFHWKEGVVTEERLPPYTVIQPEREATLPVVQENVTEDVVGGSQESPEDNVLSWLKQAAEDILEDNRNIRGKPVPSKEALRGTTVTRSAIQAELERWRAHPILSKYVPTLEEGDEEILESVA